MPRAMLRLMPLWPYALMRQRTANTTPGSISVLVVTPVSTLDQQYLIGDVEVDIDNYYIILKDCDIHVEDNGRLVTLAMSDIQ